jgi:hypothetical protein
MANDRAIRDQLARTLSWGDAHVDFDAAVGDLAPDLRGRAPAGLPYSPWQLLEHLRLTQRDILEFCRNPRYQEPTWPDDYWPASAAPPSPEAWDESVRGFKQDRDELARLAQNPATDLEAKIPHGTGQTYLREVLLAADHTAYHLGELIVVRRLLGAWPR